MKILEIELHDPVLECRKRRASPVAKSITQKHEIADNTVGNHGSIQRKKFRLVSNLYFIPFGSKLSFRMGLTIDTPTSGVVKFSTCWPLLIKNCPSGFFLPVWAKTRKPVIFTGFRQPGHRATSSVARVLLYYSISYKPTGRSKRGHLRLKD